ncbi:hypothetical protein BGZ60DRAFT_387860 [Tricladium varicosporioides]|nr:hypothetical protein BGZ60DRAFT_387860 [Hymenoscyphus varicosporioides]
MPISLAASSFTVSSLPVDYNAVKSLIFGSARFFIGFALYKCFSLIAARSDLFSSYLMFTEDYTQNFLYMWSRGFSKNTLLVLCFAILYAIANLYGTLLWGLDSPGYIMHYQNISAAYMNKSLLEDPSYIIQLDTGRNNLATLDQQLPNLMGANLYKAGMNVTLTPDVHRGSIEITTPTQTKVGGRIWLDSEGFSVGSDDFAMVTYKYDNNGTTVPLELTCPLNVPTGIGVAYIWNCTFENAYVLPLLTPVVGRPIIHYDDVSDKLLDWRRVTPSRQKNVWAAFGTGGGTALMKQVFTVTKKNRRHTFIHNVFRTTMLTLPGVPFARTEINDILKRTWSLNVTEQEAPLIGRLTNSIMAAQATNQSFMFGVNDGSDLTATQVSWEFLTPEPTKGSQSYSLMRISLSNITLIRSETLPQEVKPYNSICDYSFSNLAYGGVVTETDCVLGGPVPNPHFFGQIDTSAVLILYGLGDGRSNISAKALEQEPYAWNVENSERIDDLLIARAFIVAVDPAQVTLISGRLTPAISQLQMFLVLLSAFLAVVAWILLTLFSTSHWSSSLLQNLLAPMDVGNGRKMNPGYINPVPDIKLQVIGTSKVVTVDNAIFKLEPDSAVSLDNNAGYIPQGQFSPQHQQFLPQQYQGQHYQGQQYQGQQYQGQGPVVVQAEEIAQAPPHYKNG